MASLELTNLQAVLRAFGDVRREHAVGIQEGLDKCADMILERSQYYCPVDTGDLKASGHKEVSGRGFGAVSQVVYDDEKAVVVHDTTDHQHDPPTGARYLARAVSELRGSCAALLARHMEAKIQKT